MMSCVRELPCSIWLEQISFNFFIPAFIAELLRADTCDTRRSKREVKFSKCQVIKTLLCVLVCVQSSKFNAQWSKANKCTGKFYTFSAKWTIARQPCSWLYHRQWWCEKHRLLSHKTKDPRWFRNPPPESSPTSSHTYRTLPTVGSSPRNELP